MVVDKDLSRWNLAAAVLHITIAVFFAVFIGLKYDPKVVGINTSTYQVIQRTNRDKIPPVLTTTTKRITAHIPYFLYVLVILFPCITAGFHIHASYSNRYIKWLDKGVNPGRWVEYAITSSIMLVLVGISTGVKEFWSIVSLIISNVVLMFCGYCTEVFLTEGKPKRALLACLIGCLIFVYIWALIIAAFDDIRRNLQQVGTSTDFELILYLMVGVLGGLYLVFAIPQFIQIRRLFKGYCHSSVYYRKYIEKSYIILSFVAKFLLVFLMGWGLYGRNNARQT
jgi:hypothetical protein